MYPEVPLLTWGDGEVHDGAFRHVHLPVKINTNKND